MFEPSGFQVEFDKLVKISEEAKEIHNYLDDLGVAKDNLTLLQRIKLASLVRVK